MKKVWEYYEHAKECRSLSRWVSGEQQKLLLQMACNWEKLAAERSELTQRHPELTLEGDSSPSIYTDEPEAARDR